jgi:hypothetical protein
MTSLVASEHGSQSDESARLAACISELCVEGQRLADAMRSKQQVLVANRLVELEDATARESVAAAAFRQIEARRCDAHADLCVRLGLNPAAASLSDTLAALAQWDAQCGTNTLEQVEKAAEELTDRLAELAQLNADNAVLSANILDYTQMLLTALSRGGQQPGYDSGGKVATAPLNELLSLKA